MTGDTVTKAHDSVSTDSQINRYELVKAVGILKDRLVPEKIAGQKT